MRLLLLSEALPRDLICSITLIALARDVRPVETVAPIFVTSRKPKVMPANRIGLHGIHEPTHPPGCSFGWHVGSRAPCEGKRSDRRPQFHVDRAHVYHHNLRRLYPAQNPCYDRKAICNTTKHRTKPRCTEWFAPGNGLYFASGFR